MPGTLGISSIRSGEIRTKHFALGNTWGTHVFTDALGAIARMSWGKSILLALAWAIVCQQAGLLAGEGTGHIEYARGLSPQSGGAASVTSLRNNATVSIGGEIALDYSYRNSATSAIAPNATTIPTDASVAALALTQATLRVEADVHPNVNAFFKLDFGSYASRHDNEILEEAMLVMSAVGGSGLGFFAGKGRAPYGQDITLGMLQSYHHNANQIDSGEGMLFITDPPAEKRDPAGSDPTPKQAPHMRPGQFDRVMLAGASYSWQDRWKVEVAAFQPGVGEYRERLVVDDDRGRDSGIGASARVWWRPFEDVTLQLSAMAARSPDMARIQLRRDLDLGVDTEGTATAYAVSAGFDWRRGPWRVFGEYQHGWDWNFTKGYDTDTWQAGASREFAGDWRVGAMVEGLHIDDAGAAAPVKHDYCKLALNVRYTFASGFFILAEYGKEWLRRERAGSLDERRHGDFFGVRIGLAF